MQKKVLHLPTNLPVSALFHPRVRWKQSITYPSSFHKMNEINSPITYQSNINNKDEYWISASQLMSKEMNVQCYSIPGRRIESMGMNKVRRRALQNASQGTQLQPHSLSPDNLPHFSLFTSWKAMILSYKVALLSLSK